MTRSPTFSPAAETTTPPQTSGLSAPRPSPPGPTSPASPWLHNHAYRRASLGPSPLPSIYNAKLTVPVIDLRHKHEIDAAVRQRKLVCRRPPEDDRARCRFQPGLVDHF